jgi:hypothetical protein
MTEKDLRDLVGDDVSGEELARLQRVHDLLVMAGPPPELPPTLQAAPSVAQREPVTFSWFGQRRLGAALVAGFALLLIAFGAGYLAGHSGSGFDSVHTVLMRGTSSVPDARASIEVGKRDRGGNVPMILRVTGLPKLPGRDYYELYLTRKGRAVASCGAFKSVTYSFEGFTGWVVTRERPKTPHPGPWVMRTQTV